jgi:transposase-like protein
MQEQQTQAGAFEPAPEFTITSLETLKVFSDPLRQQIIETLLDGSKTVKQVAAELDLAPTKLYYHINLLEQHQLISVTETRIVSGIIEKQYQASARRFRLERSLLTPGQADTSVVDTVIDAMIDPIRAEIHRGIKSGLIDTSENAPQTRKLRINRELSRLSEAEAEAFYTRLEALIDEFNSFRSNHENDDTQAYTLIIGIYPIQPPNKSNRPTSE